MSEDFYIKVVRNGKIFQWTLWRTLDGYDFGISAIGSSPDYDEACRMAKIAWEQHSEGEE